MRLVFACHINRTFRSFPHLENRFYHSHTLDTSLGGSLSIDATKLKNPLELVITTKWQEKLECNSSDHVKCKYVPNIPGDSSIKLILTDNNSSQIDLTHNVSIAIPEIYDLNIFGHCNINVKTINKMMGSLFISCTTGTISIDKVKGHNISVYVERGKVEIRKIVEGNTSIFCQDLTAKMINGDAVRLHCQGTAKIETMYGKDTLLSTGGPLQIDAFRGLLQAKILHGNTVINGFDGCLDVESFAGDVQVQCNSIHNFPADGIDEESQASKVVAHAGSVSCTLDPEITTWISCDSTTDSSNNQQNSILIESDNFEAFTVDTLSCQGGEQQVIGKFTGIVPSNSNSNSKNQSSGKINLGGAAKAFEESFRGKPGHQRVEAENEDETMLTISATDKINVVTKSWIERIHNKHGFTTLPSSSR